METILKKDINILERVQKVQPKWTEIKYETRLNNLGLTTLETRRLRGDLIEVFKILKGYDDIGEDIFFVFKNFSSHLYIYIYIFIHHIIIYSCVLSSLFYTINEWKSSLRGHQLKLQKKSVRLDIAKYSFSNRVVNEWNNLIKEVIARKTLAGFKKTCNNRRFI